MVRTVEYSVIKFRYTVNDKYLIGVQNRIVTIGLACYVHWENLGTIIFLFKFCQNFALSTILSKYGVCII